MKKKALINRNLIIIMLSMVLMGIMVSCSKTDTLPASSETPQSTQTYTPSPLPTSTPTVTITASATPTFTLTPSPTPTVTQTPTYTPSPTPQIVSVVEDQSVIYSGPGEAYDLLAIYAQGVNLYSVGRSEDQNWLIVVLPDRQGWMAAKNVKADFDIAMLQIFEIPPTPVPSYTPTPSPKVVVFLVDKFVPRKFQANYEGFKSYEKVVIEIHSADSGEIVWKKSSGTSLNGNGGTKIFLNDKNKYPEGKYHIKIFGYQGSYAEGSFIIKNKP